MFSNYRLSNFREGVAAENVSVVEHLHTSKLVRVNRFREMELTLWVSLRWEPVVGGALHYGTQ
jgi:hypothetical protein